MNPKELKTEILDATVIYANKNSLAYRKYASAIIFNKIDDNFYYKSFKNIINNSSWKSRLNKRHTQVPGAYEMQSSNSSDAILMNIFGHPDINKWQGLRRLLNMRDIFISGFGINPVVYKLNKPEPRPTEVDMLINNNVICESKFTESDFTNKSKKEVEKYDHFDDIFYKSFLKGNNTEYENYQLIRNILALYGGYNRFILFCDERRPDLIIRFYDTVNCIKDISLRSRCNVYTWQQIASVVGKDLRQFLALKYGII